MSKRKLRFHSTNPDIPSRDINDNDRLKWLLSLVKPNKKDRKIKLSQLNGFARHRVEAIINRIKKK